MTRRKHRKRFRLNRRRPSIDDETFAVYFGPLELDCVRARAAGWTDAQLSRFWDKVEKLARWELRVIARRKGMTEKCPACECWTWFASDCHLCSEDRLALRRVRRQTPSGSRG